MKKETEVILASASPRRQELLKLLYADFTVIPADIDERVSDEIEHERIAEAVAVKKATALHNPDALIIGCDTVVLLDKKIMGKPKGAEGAYEMLSSLSGRVHQVITGVCLCYNGRSYSFSETTEVEFYPLTDEEISAYIMTGEPCDKAGAYGIQGLGSLFVKRINGDFYNVVGLPVSRLRHEIERFRHICSID